MTAVSVILPTRGRPGLLNRALASIAAQVEISLEVLISCEDEDPKSAERALAEVKLPGRVIFTGGKGPAIARNRACREARSAVLAFLDDDDVWLPGHLARGLKHMAVAGRPVIFHGGAANMQTGEKSTAGRHPATGEAPHSLLLDNTITTSTVMISKDLFEKLDGFEREFEPAEDYRLWLKAMPWARFEFDPELHAIISFENPRLSEDASRSLLATARAIEAHLAANSLPISSVPGLKRRLADLYHAAALKLMATGKKREGRRMLLRSIAIQPRRIGAILHWFDS